MNEEHFCQDTEYQVTENVPSPQPDSGQYIVPCENYFVERQLKSIEYMFTLHCISIANKPSGLFVNNIFKHRILNTEYHRTDNKCWEEVPGPVGKTFRDSVDTQLVYFYFTSSI